MTDQLLKRCKQCKHLKDLDEFRKHRSSHDGHVSVCNTCRNPDIVALCRLCGERPCAPRYRVCQKCRHGPPVPCPTCDGSKRPEATRCRQCSNKYQRGPQHSAWKGGRILDGHGYVRIWMPEDPRANCGRYMKEHTIVMEQHIGRQLLMHETVHHINGDRSDNRLENLELWSSHHPGGQRVEDKVHWAREILKLYGDLYG